jgi:hypothetical protein
MPRMTFTQRVTISSPAIGLQVYDTSLNTVCTYNGTDWFYPSFANFSMLVDQTTQGVILWNNTSFFGGITYEAPTGRFQLQSVGSYQVNISATIQVTSGSGSERLLGIKLVNDAGDVTLAQAYDSASVIDSNNTYGCAVINTIITTTSANTKVYFSFASLTDANARLDDVSHGYINRIV